MAANSIEAYERDISDFLRWEPKPIQDYTADDIVGYLTVLQSLGLAKSSMARKRVALKQFFDYLLENDYPLKVDFDFVPQINIPQYLPDTISVEEMKELLDSLPMETHLEFRNKVMMELLYATGVRVSELLGLSIHDRYPDKTMIRVRGKGSKQRFVPYLRALDPLLDEYLKVHRPALQKHHQSDVIFLNRFGKPLSRQGFWKILNKACISAGIKRDVSPHTFRHSFATHLLEAGVNLGIMQSLLGHSSINTTQIYTHVDTRFMQETHKQFHPRA